jgi:hypothetical protein
MNLLELNFTSMVRLSDRHTAEAKKFYEREQASAYSDAHLHNVIHMTL